MRIVAPAGSRPLARAVPPPADSGPTGWTAERILLVVGGIAALGALVAWEITRPSLPVPFELAAAGRMSPGTPSWSGRLPMAMTAIAGLIAVYTLLARTAEKRTATYAVAVLATSPAWFVHGRTMTGAMVPMVCFVAVLAGTGIAVLDVYAGPRLRAGAVAASLLAAVVAVVVARVELGIPNRGFIAVVAVPAMAVGLASLLWRTDRAEADAADTERAAKRGARGGAVLLAAGLATATLAMVVACVRPDGAAADLLLGTRAVHVHGSTTFEAPVATMAYGLVPWTPFVPFALARRPSSAGHLLVMVAAVLAVGVHSALAPRVGTSTLVGVAAVAAAVAAMLRSLEETRRPAVALLATTLVIGWLVAHDLGLSPDRVLVAFGAADTAIPTAHAAASAAAVRSSLWLCMLLTAVALLTPRTWLPAGRGLAIVGAGVFAGLALRAHAYPELLLRLSPGAAFDAWARRHHTGEPLGLMGVDRRTLAFAPDTSVVSHSDATAAGRWLAEGSRVAADGALHPAPAPAQPRRFLALAAGELPRVNAAYRAAHARNVPILAGQGSATLLAASALGASERSDNPLDAVLLDAPPASSKPIGAVLEGRLDAVGWQLQDEGGHDLEVMPRRSRKAHVRVVVRMPPGAARVTQEMSGYCTFLHIDHTPTRFSAEHRELAYPMSLWRAGDVVIDDFDVTLPPHFRAGSYRMFWGLGALPCNDDRRMHVTSGPNDGRDRIPVGTLEIR